MPLAGGDQCIYNVYTMRVRVQRWGNSLAVRLPKIVAQDAGVGEGDTLEVRSRAGRLSLVASPHYELRELIGRVTRKNSHAETTMGSPVGREAW